MMTAKRINPDLQRERDAATIDPEELTRIIFDGAKELDKKRKLEDAVFNDPDYKSIPLNFMSREEQYEEGIRRSAIAVTKKEALGDLIENHNDLISYNTLACGIGNAFFLHESMFADSIKRMATDELKQKMMPLQQKFEIIGTYAQTEMGHGTFLRGLETTAHYDPNTQEFVLNSPTVTSTKWWPGALGKTSTHAVVLAQLYTQGKCHGIHPFVVQLRSLEDHKSLPGITLGDIGPKFGYGANDNGFLRLNNHRIPRENMLMKYSQVAPDGTYTKPPKAELTYGTMTFIRSMIVRASAFGLARGTTIAIRYSAVRRQSEMRPGEPEPQVLSYPTQQYKLFPLLATAYAFFFVQKKMVETYSVVNQQINDGDYTRIQELHGLSSGLKAFTSWATNVGLEICRMSCGGHGYSMSSGFPKLYVDFTPNCTYEGENTVLLLQTARFLVKSLKEGKRGAKLPGTVAYLSSNVTELRARATSAGRDLKDPRLLVALYKERAMRQIMFASDKVEAARSEGLDLVGALNRASVHLVRAANAHSHLLVVENFHEKLQELKVSQKLKKTLLQLFQLYALDGITNCSGEFLEDGILSGTEVKAIRQYVVELLPLIRVNAVALVDAFDFRDEVLDSVLGRYDGNVYEELLKWALSSPLNKTDVHPSYDKYLKPLLHRNRSKL
uniref:Acyl-coenzyme A oxidase n=1 Tax=Phallusia mammillata TaxID=59560 RepID=A0A6F9D6I2_9ASCI|nr:peroxisomal acyl-coenzyme A oxidase 1 [Phallusia mammillata]